MRLGHIWAIMICMLLAGGIAGCGRGQSKAEPEMFDVEAERIVAPVFSNYAVGIGDSLEVKFHRHDEFNTSLKVVSPGIAMFPMVGDVQVSGRSIFELRDDLKARYARYLKNPEITINVTSMQSQKITILGEVRNPGVVMLETSMMLSEAIAAAGGASNDADTENVFLVKRKGSRVDTETINYRSILKEGRLSRDRALESGDIIFVPATRLATASWFMQHINNIVSPVVQVENGIVLFPQAKEVLRTGTSSNTVIVK